MTKPPHRPHFLIPELAAMKAAETPGTETEWADVLRRGQEGLRGHDVDLAGLEQIALACATPRQFALMVRLISHHCRVHGQGRKVFELIRRQISMTVFSLSEWVESLEYFVDWLEKHGKAIDFQNMLHYVQCCTQLPDAKAPGARLKETLVEAIEKYGVSWTGSPKRKG